MDEASLERAAEEVFELYVQYRGEQNILHNVHCKHGASVFSFQFVGTEIVIKQNRGTVPSELLRDALSEEWSAAIVSYFCMRTHPARSQCTSTCGS